MLGGDEGKFTNELERLLFQTLHVTHMEALLETPETFPIFQSVLEDTVDSLLFEPPRGDKNLVRITGSSNN